MTARHLILAIQFLTRLPTPQVADFQPQDLSRSAGFFPAVGLLIGAVLALSVWTFAHINPWLGAFAGTLTWVWITGGLHLDGLGDVTDAFGAAHRDPARFQDVLRDPHTGSFAVMIICLQLVAKLVFLAALPGHIMLPTLLLVPAFARWGTLVWSHTVPPLQEGLGERFAWDINRPSIVLWSAVLAGASLFFCPALLAALLLVPLISVYWRWRLGGISGDCLGASIEVTESLLLLAVIIATAPRGA